jgi:methionine-rich copper-binding protein CopC
MIAIAVAILLLVTVVLPAEYAIDPTGIGRPLGLTRMGEIKVALRNEAAALTAQTATGPQTSPTPDSDTLAADAPVDSITAELAAPDAEQMEVSLAPGQERALALEMKSGAKIDYEWFTDWGTVAFEMRGAPSTAAAPTRSYAKSDSRATDRGVLKAAFDGSHGWTWRNIGKEAVTVTLRVKGDYKNLKATPRHLELVGSDPQKDQTIARPPIDIQLVFSESVDSARTVVTLDGPSGRVELGPVRLQDEALLVQTKVVGSMSAGTYTVSWTAASPEMDPVKGSFHFTVRQQKQRSTNRSP